ENNSQRSVSYGDGVYRQADGGRHWQNLGLKGSEHIARIVVDPRNSDVVYVAAQGPLWAAGGDRGIYKTADGGKTWKRMLTISDNTGGTDLGMDPRHPAEAHQRPAEGRHGAHRPGRGADRSRRRLRHHRGGARRLGLLPLPRRGRQLGEAELDDPQQPA